MEGSSESADPADRLTEAQLRCIRLVHLGSSKRIAAALGISHNTVNVHISAAIARLGVTNRHDAALLVASGGRGRTNDDLTSAPSSIAPRRLTDMLGEPGLPSPVETDLAEMNEAPSFYHLDTLPPAKSNRTDHGSALRTFGRAVALTAGLAIIVAAAKPLGEGAEAVANLVQQYRSSQHH